MKQITYTESVETGNSFRAEYLDGVKKIIEKRIEKADKSRREFDKKLVSEPEVYRRKLIEMCGWPLTERFQCGKEPESLQSITAAELPNVRKQFVTKDGEYSIYRMQLEVMSGLWFYGILFVNEDGCKRPFVIAQHGNLGTPERISSLIDGYSGNYNEMNNRILTRDVNVFAPQMLMWRSDVFGNEYDRNKLDAQLKQCGSSIIALELYSLMRSLDWFEKEDYVDRDYIGMVGMSMGGMYTMYMSAIDQRIRSAVASSFFSRHYDVLNPNYIFRNAGSSFMDAEKIMLVRPRKIYLAMGDEDTLFKASDSIKEFEIIKEIYPDWQEWCDLHIFKGTHEFIPNDELLDRMISDLKRKTNMQEGSEKDEK